MTPSPSSPAAAPLPPLPNLSGAGESQGASAGPQSAMSSIVSGIAPVKKAVDDIIAAAKQVVQSGAIPGAEQVCGQIVALAVSLLPMAAQQALQPSGLTGGVSAGGLPPGGPGGLTGPVGGPSGV